MKSKRTADLYYLGKSSAKATEEARRDRIVNLCFLLQIRLLRLLKIVLTQECPFWSTVVSVGLFWQDTTAG